MMDAPEARYDKKLALLKATANHEKTGKVPVLSMAQTWAIAYAGTTAEDAFSSVEREIEVYGKLLEDIDYDATCLFGMNRPLAMYESMGYSPFFISRDGITLQHEDNCILEENELDEYTENPLRFLRNKALYRRYPALQQEFPGDVQALGNALQLMIANKAKTDSLPGILRERYGTPMVCGQLMEPALDRYICYRSFAKGMTDLRRRPEKVLAALEATYSIVEPGPMPMEAFPWVFLPVVTVTYLNRKYFETFFWPTAKRMMDRIIELGGKIAIAMEGKWAHVYDYLLEYPKGSVIAFVESDDMIQAKRDIGHKVALCGGMPLQLLKTGSKQQNIDHIKHIIDECGREGIMLTQEQGLLSPNDVKAENLRAVVDFVHEYTA